MILFTGSGKVAEIFQKIFPSKIFPSKIISARNLNDYELKEEIKGVKAIIHNSALIQADKLDDFIVSNFLLTRKIINICEEVNPKVRFVNLSSMSILLNDSACIPVDEMTNYAYSKYISEEYCIRSNLENLTSVRFSTIYYGDEDRDGVSKLVMDAVINNKVTLFNDGAAKRDILPIRILVMYLQKICKVNALSRKYNIVSGDQTSFMGIVRILLKSYPDLLINNEQANSHSVLSVFSKKDIISLGEIYFDLEDEIKLQIMGNA